MAAVMLWKDGTEDSLVGSVALALEWRKAGEEVTIVVTEEALAALGGRGLVWSDGLKDRPARIALLKGARELGLSYHRDFDARWSEPAKLLAQASEQGVRFVADPIWVKLLGVDGELPDLIERTDAAGLLRTLREASPLIGGF